MPRYRRHHTPGQLVHVNSRFVSGEFRIRSPADRAEYLARAAAAAAQTDWTPLAYAVMSSHVHWIALAGADPCARFVQPLHTGFAQWLHRRYHTSGPVFAARPSVVAMGPARALRAICYVHNNPVRAGLVVDPLHSDWTSHRAFVGHAAAPPWLAIDYALALCGYDASPEGRAAFHAAVLADVHEGRDPTLSARRIHRTRAEMRRRLEAPVEISDATLASHAAAHAVVALPGTPARAPWPGDLSELLVRVARDTGVSVERMLSRARDARVVRARRLFVGTATMCLHRRVGETGAVVGLSVQGASQLLRKRPARWAALRDRGEALALECLAITARAPADDRAAQNAGAP